MPPSEPTLKPTYRPEIDGLRAVAVLPVMLFHAGIGWFEGGYVGVDVFFVLSGYLITAILLKELSEGRFSLVHFYERRARRILPPLAVVMAACVPFAWAWMTADQLRDFGRSLVAVSVFGSNILFFVENGYFGAPLEEKPLLHTWSLAVEEQYYFVFPLLLLAAWRLGFRFSLGVVAMIAVFSFLLAQFGGNLHPLGQTGATFDWVAIPSYAFYLTPTRAWELLIGALCAFALYHFGRTAVSRMADSQLAISRLAVLQLAVSRLAASPTAISRWHDAAAGAGLLLIAYAVLTYDEHTPFPGAAALVPTVGTALIVLFASRGTRVARLLSASPLVGIGLISYGAYLWHQPLFAFARLRTLGEVPKWVLLMLGVVSLGLAYASWRWIERPVRDARRVPRRQIFALAGASSVAFLAVGLAAHVTDGFSNRFDPSIVQLQRPAIGDDDSSCGNEALKDDLEIPLCTIGASDGPLVAVLGDSHALSLRDALHTLGVDLGVTFLPINDHWCAPLHDFGTEDSTRNTSCRRLMTNAIERVAANQEIRTVMLVAEWANYTTGRRWRFEKRAAYGHGAFAGEDPGENPETFAEAVLDTLALLENKHVIVVKSVPEYATRVPDTLAKSVLFADGELPLDLRVSRKKYRARNRDVELAWASVPPGSVEFIETVDVFCDDWCRYMNDSGVFYVDDNHLSELGATLLLQHIAARISELAAAD